MNRSAALLLISFLAPSVTWAGIITGGEGITTNAKVVAVHTPAPNNGDDPGPTPNEICLESDKPPPGADPSDPNQFSVYYRFHVTPCLGASTKYLVKEIVHNIGPVDFLSFHYSIGYFLNGCFQQYPLADWVVIDAVSSTPTSSAFSAFAADPTMLSWTGGNFHSGSTENFSFSIIVPDAPAHLPPGVVTATGYDFVLQTCPIPSKPTSCPEPGTLAGMGLGIAGLVWAQARARRRNPRLTPPNIPRLPRLR